MRQTLRAFLPCCFTLLLLVAATACHQEPKNGDDGVGGMDGTASDSSEMTKDDDSVDMSDDMIDGRICNSPHATPCEEGWFCEIEPGNCPDADLQGVCVEAKRMCTKEYRPVCGCDGQTYGNDCMRRASRVQKDHDGECKG